MSRRLFVAPAQLVAGTVTLSGASHHYLCRVLRLRRGAPVTLLDGAGRSAAAHIDRVEPDHVVLTVAEPVRGEITRRCELTVVMALIKGARTEWAIEKLVELGVHRIMLVHTERTVVRLDARRAAGRLRRYASVAEAAARQCGATTVARITGPDPLADALVAVSDGGPRLWLWERARGAPLRAAVTTPPPARAAVLVGPEGGWTDREAERVSHAGWQPVGLGARILRAETAAVTATAILAAQFGLLD